MEHRLPLPLSFPLQVGNTCLPLPLFHRLRCVHEVSHVLHVSPATWTFIILFLGAVLLTPSFEEAYLGIEINVYYIIGLGWCLWLLVFTLKAKLSHVRHRGHTHTHTPPVCDCL